MLENHFKVYQRCVIWNVKYYEMKVLIWEKAVCINKEFSRGNVPLHFRNQYWYFLKLNFDLLKISHYLFDIDRNNTLGVNWIGGENGISTI